MRIQKPRIMRNNSKMRVFKIENSHFFIDINKKIIYN